MDNTTEKTAKTKKQPTFEQALERLGEIADILENENPALDKALTLYEEGASLIKLCSAQLEKAEAQITLISGKN